MAWTPTTFKARWEEFSATADALITAVLAEAALECDARVYGDSYDHAVGLLTAHKLSISPGGQQARLEAKGGDGTTTYLAELNRLSRRRAGGPWAMGQTPTGLLP